MITSAATTRFTGTYFPGEQGERGNSQQPRGFEPFPLIKCLGNRGNTNLFLNITIPRVHAIWLLPFPLFFCGERGTPANPPGNIGCSPVPPVPPFFSHRHILSLARQRPSGGQMSLLASLLDHLPAMVPGPPASQVRVPIRPRLTPAANARRMAETLTGAHVNAAIASPEWRKARDQYINHLMACRGCYAPSSRHCQRGAQLRATYDEIPMELRP